MVQLRKVLVPLRGNTVLTMEVNHEEKELAVLVPFRGKAFLNPVPGNPLYKRASGPFCG